MSNSEMNIATLNTWRNSLSALWVSVIANIAFADIVGFITPGTLQTIINGNTGIVITPQLLLIFSLLLEIPIAMIVLSQVLRQSTLRWITTAAAMITAMYVVGAGSNSLSYYFFAAKELIAMAAAVWIAWKGPQSYFSRAP